jgi:hypothetical protein
MWHSVAPRIDLYSHGSFLLLCLSARIERDFALQFLDLTINFYKFQDFKMSVWIPLVAVTAFWALIGAGGPFLVPSGPNRG